LEQLLAPCTTWRSYKTGDVVVESSNAQTFQVGRVTLQGQSPATDVFVAAKPYHHAAKPPATLQNLLPLPMIIVSQLFFIVVVVKKMFCLNFLVIFCSGVPFFSSK
jgi:hypothetical protein